MQRLFFLCLLVVFVCLSAKSQSGTVHGSVRSDVTGQVLGGVSVFMEETGALTETDERGAFVFSSVGAGVYTLTFFGTGYGTKVQQVEVRDSLVKLDIRMEPVRVDLATVEIRDQADQPAALRRLRNVEGYGIYAAKKSEVIELAAIPANLATNNPREVFQGVAGLNIWESDGAGLQLGIGARGLDPNRTSSFNTRQNGYDISADALGYPEAYYTPPMQALDRIEIVRGAASLQYGTQFGGLLNFVFKRGPEDDPFTFHSEQTVGSYGLLSSFNSVGGTVGDVNYYAFYQYRGGDGWRPNAGFDQHTAYAQMQYQPSRRLQIGVEFTHMQYLAQQPGGLVDFEFQQDPRRSKRGRNWFAVNWNLGAVTLDYRVSERARLNWRTFGLSATRESLGELGPINRPDPLRERDLIRGSYENVGSELRYIQRYETGGSFSTFLAGIRYYRGFTQNRQGLGNDEDGPDFRFLNPDDLESFDYDFPSRNAAFFAENLFNINDQWSITPGVRVEYIRTSSEGYYKERVTSGGEVIFEQRFEDAQSRERTFLLAGLGVGFRPSSEVEAYANISQNYRSINFTDLVVSNPNLRIDPDLTDERGFNADLGLRGSLWQNRFQFDLSLFYLRYNDRIGLSEIRIQDEFTGLERALAYRTNVGNARIYGLETYLETDLWKWYRGPESPVALSAFLNLSLLNGQYTSGERSVLGKQVELISPVSVRTGLRFRAGNLAASILYSYIGAQYSDATNAEQVADATRGRIPAYSVLDTSVKYQWRKWTVSTGVNNLLDRRYFTRRATSYPGPGIIPAEARSFYLSLGVTL